jgi:hypothetical protein
MLRACASNPVNSKEAMLRAPRNNEHETTNAPAPHSTTNNTIDTKQKNLK